MKNTCSPSGALTLSETLGEPFVPPGADELVYSVIEAFKSRPRFPLGDLTKFDGCGIYGFYYKGENALYREWFEFEEKRLGTNDIPIYIGKADAKGRRTGGWMPLLLSKEKQLYQRVFEHAQSIRHARNLSIEDFECRVLVTQPLWVQPTETLLIAEYQPLWNSVIDGFGLHHPGTTRFGQLLSAWDSLHPGRSWSAKMRRKQDPNEIARRIRLEIDARSKLG